MVCRLMRWPRRAKQIRRRGSLARWVRAAAMLAVALSAAACGAATTRTHSRTSSSSALPPAAEPALSPPARQRPVGESIYVGTLPEGIVADPRTGLVVVGVRQPAGLVLLDARTGAVRAKIAIPGAPRHLQLAAPGGPVLVPEEPVASVLEVGLPSGRTVRAVKVRTQPHDATVADGRIFVGNEFGRSLSVIEGPRVIDTIDGFVQPGGVVGMGNDVGVVDVRANDVTLVDARSLRIMGRASAGAGPTHGAAGAGGKLYVLDTRGGAVLSFATQPRLRRLARLRLPGAPYGVAIDLARGRLWVTLTAQNELAELSTAGPKLRLIRTYPTGRQPDTVAVDPGDGRVFVANAADGTVERIDPHR